MPDGGRVADVEEVEAVAVSALGGGDRSGDQTAVPGGFRVTPRKASGGAVRLPHVGAFRLAFHRVIGARQRITDAARGFAVPL